MNHQATVTPNPVIRVIIADDHEMARSGLRAMLSDSEEISLVGEARNGDEAFMLCQSALPDVALTDLRMPGIDGIALAGKLRKANSKTAVIVITNHDSDEHLAAALAAGASGYILKDSTRLELIAAIMRVSAGYTAIDSELAARRIRQQSAATIRNSRNDTPTARECEVLQLAAEGLGNREIAAKLNISAGTVKVHMEHLLTRLQAADRTQAVIKGIVMGLIQVEGIPQSGAGSPLKR